MSANQHRFEIDVEESRNNTKGAAHYLRALLEFEMLSGEAFACPVRFNDCPGPN